MVPMFAFAAIIGRSTTSQHLLGGTLNAADIVFVDVLSSSGDIKRKRKNGSTGRNIMAAKEFCRPEDDPSVIAAIREGRHAYDLYLIECPACFTYSYYNQGQHASCYNCHTDLSGYTCDAITLEDYWNFASYPCDEPKRSN